MARFKGRARISVVLGRDSALRQASIICRYSRDDGAHGDWLLVGLLLVCVSTAPSSFILARQLGGTAPLMAGIVAVQTVMAIWSVPLVLWFAEKMNWISLA